MSTKVNMERTALQRYFQSYKISIDWQGMLIASGKFVSKVRRRAPRVPSHKVINYRFLDLPEERDGIMQGTTVVQGTI
jgi:hypothetical protein